MQERLAFDSRLFRRKTDNNLNKKGDWFDNQPPFLMHRIDLSRPVLASALSCRSCQFEIPLLYFS
jgi:hypothetical protein